MRFARGMGKLKSSLVLLMCVLLVGGIIVTAQAQDAKTAPAQDATQGDVSQQIAAGKMLFEETNCLMCHLLNGEGGGLEGAPDLAGVLTRRDQVNLREWLNTHLFEEPRIDMFEEDPTQEDIAALVQYLSTL